MAHTTDWQRDDTVVLYRTPHATPYGPQAFYDAANHTLKALDLQISQKKVALKPNVVSGVSPYSGITIPPDFLRGTVDYLTGLGIAVGEIRVGDGGGGEAQRDMFEHYHNVGFDTLAGEMGFKLVDINSDDFVRVPINGVVFDEMPIAATFYDQDAFFLNMPKMRTHNLGITTIALKAMQGAVTPVEERHMCTLFPRWPGDRGAQDLRGDVLDTHERWAHKILDISLARKPDLNLVDALVPRDGTGFRRGSDRPMGWTLASINQTAVDTIGSSLMGFEPNDLTYLRLAGERGCGPNKVADIRVLEIVDGKLVERTNKIEGLVANPPFKVTLSATLTYQSWEKVLYSDHAEVEPGHAKMTEDAAGGGAD
jgi:uncharacterized protein (DUF362 family)